MKTVFIAIDHGIGLAYFLNTDLIDLLLKNNVRVVLLVQDELIQPLRQQFASQPNLVVESLRLKAAAKYQESYHGGVQAMMDYVRRTSANHTIPLTYVDTHRQRKEYEGENFKRKEIPGLHAPVDLAAAVFQDCPADVSPGAAILVHAAFV